MTSTTFYILFCIHMLVVSTKIIIPRLETIPESRLKSKSYFDVCRNERTYYKIGLFPEFKQLSDHPEYKLPKRVCSDFFMFSRHIYALYQLECSAGMRSKRSKLIRLSKLRRLYGDNCFEEMLFEMS